MVTWMRRALRWLRGEDAEAPATTADWFGGAYSADEIPPDRVAAQRMPPSAAPSGEAPPAPPRRNTVIQ